MYITLMYISGKNQRWLTEQSSNYCLRVRRPWQLRQKRLPLSKKHNSNVQQAIEEESRALLKASNGSTRIALLSQGRQMNSVEFAHFLKNNSERSPLAFLLGGPGGISERAHNECTLRVSLSAMTWPHALVRLLVCEQIYRASTIIFGGNYHK